MIDRCFNLACNKELRYLRSGRVVRVVRGKGEHIEIEHYWLCGSCSLSHNFVFPTPETVALGPRYMQLMPAAEVPPHYWVAA
jgi:hypothetical protein